MKKPKAHKRKVAHKKPKVTPGPLAVPAPHHKKPAHHPQQQGGKGHHGPKVSGGPVVVPAHPKQARQKKRGLALGGGWECCSAEALGASLRLAGWPVAPSDVLALHVAAGGSRDTGVSILAALQTAARVGLAGVRPAIYGRQPLDDARRDVVTDLIRGEVAILNECLPGETQALDGIVPLAADGCVLGGGRPRVPEQLAHGGQRNGLILGTELPGPHALAVDGPGVWSWGEWHPWEDFGDAVIEEAWLIKWEAQ